MMTYALLKIKYRDFYAPTLKLKVDGTEIVHSKKCTLDNLRVELSTGMEASGCSFDVYNLYEPKESDFDRKGAFAKMQLGAKVEVELGYISTSGVFEGLITEVSYQFSGEGDAPFIHVECMDAKVLLMKTQRLEIFGDVKLDKVVKEMFGTSPVSSYLSGKKVESVASVAVPMHNHMCSDYDYLVMQAQYYGCEFFISQGKVYFREAPSFGMPAVMLSPKEGILQAKVSLSGAGLIKKVTVTGVDPTGEKQITASQSVSGKFSSGNTAKKMLGSAEKVFYDPYCFDKMTATKRAKALMKSLTDEFGRVECTCIGLPEIEVGEYIKVSGLMKEGDGTFYVTAVTHTFDESGFFTTFEARFDSV